MAKSILIVDKSPCARQVVALVLHKAGYDIIEANNGEEAISKIGGEKIHLIITELNMPVMGGFAMIAKLKEIPESKSIPIIMLTTKSNNDAKEQSESVGVKAWLLKPFEPVQILKVVEKLL